jgi:5-dehydro-4-deoxyglucarate dehydratase
MTVSGLQHQLKGVLGFPVTPFQEDLSLNIEELERNVAAMAEYPFCALVAAGGAGEIFSLTVEEILQVVKATIRAVAGRIPVVAGVGFNTGIAVLLARQFEKAGADALLILPPYYSNAPERGLHDYYRAIEAACELPLIIYSRDWAAFTPDRAARLVERVPRVAAWKDGQGDMRKFQKIMAKLGDRLTWIGGAGDDAIGSYFAIGVQAYTSSISNIAPRLSLALAEAGAARDFERVRELVNKYVLPLYAIRDRSKGYEVAVTKQAMEILGMKAGPVRPPLSRCSPEDAQDIRRVMDLYKDFLE